MAHKDFCQAVDEFLSSATINRRNSPAVCQPPLTTETILAKPAERAKKIGMSSNYIQMEYYIPILILFSRSSYYKCYMYRKSYTTVNSRTGAQLYILFGCLRYTYETSKSYISYSLVDDAFQSNTSGNA